MPGVIFYDDGIYIKTVCLYYLIIRKNNKFPAKLIVNNNKKIYKFIKYINIITYTIIYYMFILICDQGAQN